MIHIMYVAMATAAHMDYILPLNRVPHFKCFCKQGMCVCGLFVQSMQLHTHEINGNMEHS